MKRPAHVEKALPIGALALDALHQRIAHLPGRLLAGNMLNPLQMSSELGGIFKPLEVEPARRDRRERTRSAVRWPVLLFRHSSAEVAQTVTENLNCSGFFCFSEIPLAPGEVLDCFLRVPAFGAGAKTSALTLFCNVRVVRVERASLYAPVGVACRIESYRCIADSRVRKADDLCADRSIPSTSTGGCSPNY